MHSGDLAIQPIDLKTQKRGDLVAEQVKRWITARNLKPGDKLPKEGELQELFSVSKGTAREALKSLEVQGLITLSTGPQGGATVAEVPIERTFQFLQNYLFFKEVSVENLYEVRLLLEPDLAAGAVPHLTALQIDALEESIERCSPAPESHAHALQQRQEDLRFHSILATANPNPFLGMLGEMINEMLRTLVVFHGNASHQAYQKFGRDNVRAHQAIVAAIRAGDGALVRRLMREHIVEAEAHVRKLQGVLQSKLVLDSDLNLTLQARRKIKK